jgi:hypothetical protein
MKLRIFVSLNEAAEGSSHLGCFNLLSTGKAACLEPEDEGTTSRETSLSVR